MKISSIIKTNLALTREQGEKVRDRIIQKLHHGKRITLDCSDLTCMTFTFIQPISEIIHIYPEPILKQKLRFINISRFHAAMIEKCFADKKYRK